MESVVGTLERAGRLILWLTLAAVCITIPIGMFGRDKAAAEALAQEKAAAEAKQKKADALAAEEAKKPERLLLSSMGGIIRGLDRNVGSVWFTNASARAGVVCVDGVATHVNGQTTESLTACQVVEPYASNVKIALMFAGGDIRKVCPNDDCTLSVKDAPATESMKVVTATK